MPEVICVGLGSVAFRRGKLTSARCHHAVLSLSTIISCPWQLTNTSTGRCSVRVSCTIDESRSSVATVGSDDVRHRGKPSSLRVAQQSASKATPPPFHADCLAQQSASKSAFPAFSTSLASVDYFYHLVSRISPDAGDRDTSSPPHTSVLPSYWHTFLLLWRNSSSPPAFRLLPSDFSTWSETHSLPPSPCPSPSPAPSPSLSLSLPPSPHSPSPSPSSSSPSSPPPAPCITMASRSDSALRRSQSRLVTARDLQSMQGLRAWLGERMPVGTPSLDTWGRQKGTKCLSNLWSELLEGEACLSDSHPPCRAVSVVSVRVKHARTGKLLVEARQQMQDGSVRVRNRPLSEKMKPGETVEEASLRGIHEELGPLFGDPCKVTLLPESILTEVEERDSFSYPGLPSRYTVHSIVAVVVDLPEGPFSTVEGEADALCSRGAYASDVTGRCQCSPHGPCGCGQGKKGAGQAETEAGQVEKEAGHIAGVQVHFWEWVDQLPESQ